MKVKLLFKMTRKMTNSRVHVKEGATGSWVKIAKAVFWGNGRPLLLNCEHVKKNLVPFLRPGRHLTRPAL